MITKKIFLDAKIFNDIFDNKRKNHKQSKATLSFALQNDIKIYTSCNIITNIYYITEKYTSKQVALQSLDSLKEIINIIPFSTKELSLTIELMKGDKDYSDMEDTIQYILAREEQCDLIISNDKKFTSKNVLCLSSDTFCKNNNIKYY